MRHFVLIVSLLFLGLHSYTQVDKKLKKIFNYDVIQLEARNNYVWAPSGDIIFYPSDTKKGDTTGASNDGEFLMFRDDIISKSEESFKLFRLDWVTNYDYEKFVKWVRDSTTLEYVYLNTDPTGNDAISDEDIGEMLNHPETYYDSASQEYTYFDPSQPFINRQLFHFSWTMRGIHDGQIIPLISELYLPPYERFNDEKIWDERKFMYGSKGSGKEILIAPNRDVWAEKSQYPYDFYYNLANYYSREQASEFYPVIGLLGTQIQAYLEYEEKKLQQILNENDFNYTVHLSLPTEEEIKLADTSDCDCKMSYIMRSKDMTEQWQITNQEYWEFLSWAQDSILREVIYLNSNTTGKNSIGEEDIGNMLNHTDVYYAEVNLAWQEFDPTDAFKNRQLFPFNYDFNWEKKLELSEYVPLIKKYFEHPEKLDAKKAKIEHRDFKAKNYVYKYSWQDLGRRAQKGELIWNENSLEYELTDNWVGKGYSMDNKTLPGFETGMRVHEDLSLFQIEETISVYPGAICSSCNKLCQHEFGSQTSSKGKTSEKCPHNWDENIAPYDFWSEPEALVEGINYYQALAYYNWKYHRHTWWNKTDTRFYDDLVPTAEQFQKVQKGESIILEEQDLQYPNPWFRYVVHFYPK